jgi:small subunit ribosomal protein S17
METECNDKNCPNHGSLSLRGRTFKGVVIADVMQHTVTVEWERRKNVKKYERYEKKRTRVKAHNPECIAAQKGDIVEIMECRPLSKTKNFVIVKKAGKERLFAEREQLLEESRVKQKKAEKKHEEKPAEVEEEIVEEEDESN